MPTSLPGPLAGTTRDRSPATSTQTWGRTAIAGHLGWRVGRVLGHLRRVSVRPFQCDAEVGSQAVNGPLLLLLRLLPIVVLVLLTPACGGGGPALDPAVSTPSASEVAALRRQVLSTVGSAVTPDETLDWAEFKFPSLFAKGTRSYPLLYEGVAYTVRSYPNGNNLGITASGGIFGLGPFTNGELRALGSVSDFGPQIRADRCLVNASACVSAPFSVTATVPNEQATVVSTTAPLKVTFSALLASAVPPSGAVRLTSEDGDVPLSVAVSANELTVTPTLRLAPGRLHTLVVDTGVTDAGGRNLTRTTRVQFTTEGPAWSEPEDISFLGCQRGGVSHVLLDDGLLLMACTEPILAESVNNPPVWLRRAREEWQVLLRPPSPTARVHALKKLGGSRVAVVWFTPNATPNEYTLQLWSAASGIYASRPILRGDIDAILSNGQMPRLVSGGLALFNIDADTVAVPPVSLPALSSVLQSCADSKGGVSALLISADNPARTQYSLWGVSYLPGSGWQQPVLVDKISTFPIGVPGNGFCFGSGGARFLLYFVYPSQNTEARMYDAAAGFWLPMRGMSSTGIAPGIASPYVVADAVGYGPGLLLWSDFARNPASTLGSLQPYYPNPVSLVPRVFHGGANASVLTEVTGVPRYDGTTRTELRFIAAAHNPRSGRFVLLTEGGAVNSKRRLLTEWDPAGRVWTQPWPLPTAFSDVSTAGPIRMSFNPSGAGVVIQGNSGRLILSDWK